MAKNTRGKGIVKLPAQGRGTCPICGRTGVKLLHEWKNKEDKTIKVCKVCRNVDPEKHNV